MEDPAGNQGRMVRSLLTKHNNTARSLAASKKPEVAATARIQWPVLIEVLEAKGSDVVVRPDVNPEVADAAQALIGSIDAVKATDVE